MIRNIVCLAAVSLVLPAYAHIGGPQKGNIIGAGIRDGAPIKPSNFDLLSAPPQNLPETIDSPEEQLVTKKLRGEVEADTFKGAKTATSSCGGVPGGCITYHSGKVMLGELSFDINLYLVS